MTAKLVLWLALAAGVALALGLAVHGIRESGREAERQSINRQNQEAGDAADSARSRFDLCPVGMWDYGARRCQRTAPGRGN